MRNMYGYARVSSKDQSLDRQLDAFNAFGVPVKAVFSDKASGKDFERSEYRRLVGLLAEGDVLVVKSIDRLGRNYEEILEEWRVITKERKAAIVVLDMPLLDMLEARLRQLQSTMQILKSGMASAYMVASGENLRCPACNGPITILDEACGSCGKSIDAMRNGSPSVRPAVAFTTTMPRFARNAE